MLMNKSPQIICKQITRINLKFGKFIDTQSIYKDTLHLYMLVINRTWIEDIIYNSNKRYEVAMDKSNKTCASHKDKIVTCY